MYLSRNSPFFSGENYGNICTNIIARLILPLWDIFWEGESKKKLYEERMK